MMTKQAWLLVALSLFFAAASAVWLMLDQSPAGWDDAWYLTNSLVLFDALGEGGLPGYAAKYFTMFRTKPPLIAVLPTPAYLVLGRRWHSALAVNLACLVVMFFALYAIARRCRGERCALMAVFAAGTMPLLYGLARRFLVECSLTSLVCLTIYLVIRTLETRSARDLFWLGAACGLGVLLKTTFALYVSLAVLYLVARLAWERQWSLARVAAFLSPAIFLPLPWYAVNYRQVLGRAVYMGFSDEAAVYGTGPVTSPSAIGRYLLKVVNEGASAYYVLLAAALVLLFCVTGKLGAWWRGWSKEGRIVLVLWALPFFVFLFGRGKDVKWIAPLLPVFILLLASLIDLALVWTGRWKGAAIGALLAFPLLAFLHTSFGVLGNRRIAAAGLTFAGRDIAYARVYDPRGWPHGDILDRIMRAATFHGAERKTVLIGSDREGFNGNNFELAAAGARLPLQIATSAYVNDLTPALDQLHAASFFVYKEGGEPEASFYNRHQKALIRAAQDSGGFREIPYGRVLPDGGVARIFENLGIANHPASGVLIRAGADRASPYVFEFGGLLQITGFAFEQSREALALRLRWRCLRPADREYVCFVHILDRDGNLVGQMDHRLLGGDPSVIAWRPGDEALESLAFPLAAGRSANAYRVRLGLYYVPTGERLPSKIVSGGPGFTLADGETAVVSPAAAIP